MKVEINEKGKTKERDFPKLMIATIDGEIVFFRSNGCGTPMNQTCSRIGQYSEDWVMECFQDFEGSITLSND